jgi:hypothetical protein
MAQCRVWGVETASDTYGHKNIMAIIPAKGNEKRKKKKTNEAETNLKQLADLCSVDGRKQIEFQLFLCCYVIQHIAEKSENSLLPNH